jgi:hypothetical protein
MKQVLGALFSIALWLSGARAIAADFPGKPISECDRLFHFYGRFGFTGSSFKTPNGSIEQIEGGLGFLHTTSGDMWAFQFENQRVFTPLDQRQMYFALVSGNADIGCGEKLREFSLIPPSCIVTERSLTWEETKIFLKRNLTPRNQRDIAAWEKFLTDSIGRSDSMNPEEGDKKDCSPKPVAQATGGFIYIERFRTACAPGCASYQGTLPTESPSAR